jgi:hypothetical protein
LLKSCATSAGELAEAFQALGALEPGLELLPLCLLAQPVLLVLRGDPVGDVADRGEHDRPVVGTQRAEGDLDGHFGTVAPQRGPVWNSEQLGRSGGVAQVRRRVGQAARQQVPHRHVDHVEAAAAEQAFGLAVDQHDPAGAVDAQQRVGRRVEYGLHLRLGPLALADIARDRRDAHGLAVRPGQRRHEQRHRNGAAVVADAYRAVPVDAAAGGHQRADLGLVHAPVGRDERVDRPAEHPFRLVSVEPLGARVPGQDRAVEVGGDDRVV